MYCREVSVRETNSKASGSCNGCTEYTTAEGVVQHTVFEINLRSSSVRVCSKCAKDLLNILKATLI